VLPSAMDIRGQWVACLAPDRFRSGLTADDSDGRRY
jgi:hypothetical protein